MIVKKYQIKGMHCMGCVKKVQQAFISHSQISEANVNLEKSSVMLKMINMLQFDEFNEMIDLGGLRDQEDAYIRYAADFMAK